MRAREDDKWLIFKLVTIAHRGLLLRHNNTW